MVISKKSCMFRFDTIFFLENCQKYFDKKTVLIVGS